VDPTPEPAGPPQLPARFGIGAGAVVVRRATLLDVPALRDLYDRLGATDRYRRFFCGGQPTRSTVERWVGGGDSIVVVAECGGRIVADAGVARAPGRRFELGIAVDPGRRGWLGPYLLDVVLRLASAAGVDAVAADVLATNGPMLGLLASRGAAVLPSADPAVVRLLLGTTTAVPGWDGSPPGRARVLLGPGAGAGAATALERAGYDVVSCRGPGAPSCARRWHCPVLDGAPCPLVDGADVVVLPGADGPPAATAVGAALPTVHPDAVVVRARPGAPPSEVVAAVERATAEVEAEGGQPAAVTYATKPPIVATRP
jgi:hypothetical protein